MRDRQGFAIVVVVLVSAIALLAFLFAASTLTLASRSSASQERSSTQALLAADSGLKTLQARAASVTYDPATHGAIDTWIGSAFNQLDLGGGVRAELAVIDSDLASADKWVLIESTGITGTSRRVLVQQFEVVSGPPVPASVAVPGALTSVGNINNASNAMRIHGRENDEEAWVYPGVEVCSGAEGEYFVDSSGVAYEILDEEPSCAGTVNVRRVGGVEQTLSGSTVGELRPVAIKEPMAVNTATNPPTSVVAVTDGARVLFGTGTPITIGDAAGGGPSQGVVTSVEDNVLTIEWSTPPGGAPIAEATVIRRHVASGVTSGDCNIREESFPDGCDEDADLDDLFYKTFGVANPQLLKDSLGSSQLISNSELRDGRVLSGITWLSDPENNVRGQTGDGILIIENNPGQSITLNVANEFTGLIYVIGDANIQGNTTMIGAIVVDGAATISTNVQGTGEKVEYDPLALTRALAGITFPNPDAGGLGFAEDNTWRVR